MTRLPLPALLSQALVAFTIEFDNEFEHQMPHRTTRGPAANSSRGPWLVSQAMWSNFVQFVGDDGVPLREVAGLARIVNLKGLQRWGYIVVETEPVSGGSGPLREEPVVRLSRGGRRARPVWRPLAGVIEGRWRARFGEDDVAGLRAPLQAVIDQIGVELPQYLPGLAHDMRTTIPDLGTRKADGFEGIAPPLDLSALLAKVLILVALEFERESKASLPVSANVLRVLDEQGVRLRDLPRKTGVSKEAINMLLGSLQRGPYVIVERDPAHNRTMVARLTTTGRTVRDAYAPLLDVIEARWRERFGEDPIGQLREILERLVGEPTLQPSPLAQGLEPYSDGWRAFAPKYDTLPHYPMVLHRGGYPDGS